MTVILNEGAIRNLLEAENGPVGRFVERVAQRVTAQAQTNVRNYFASAPSLNVDQDVDYSMQGSNAIIGFRPDPNPHEGESKGERFARLEAGGQIRVGLAAALEAGRQ